MLNVKQGSCEYQLLMSFGLNAENSLARKWTSKLSAYGYWLAKSESDTVLQITCYDSKSRQVTVLSRRYAAEINLANSLYALA